MCFEGGMLPKNQSLDLILQTCGVKFEVKNASICIHFHMGVMDRTFMMGISQRLSGLKNVGFTLERAVDPIRRIGLQSKWGKRESFTSSSSILLFVSV